MKKMCALVLMVFLAGCVTVPETSEIPTFAQEMNGYVWLQMDAMTQIVFLYGFAAGECEMSIYLDEPWAWQELATMGLSYQQIAELITQYYFMTNRLEDSMLMVFRLVVTASAGLEEPAAPMQGGV